jgi:hypothetical protein
LVDAVVEVHRSPENAPVAARGWRYAIVEVKNAGDYVTPLAAPDHPIAVTDLMP